MNQSLPKRMLAGMRVSGALHLGHYHGVIKTWLKLQNKYECYFFAADLHGLTTHYQHTEDLKTNTLNMVMDWLASGVDPNSACLFIQSKVPEHAELHLLLSMQTPLSWLEQIPTYKDQLSKLKTLHLNTYGFLGYPILMSADILLYRAQFIAVGEDQLPHIEMARQVARRFNHLYGRDIYFIKKSEQLLERIKEEDKKQYLEFRRRYQEEGSHEALELAQQQLDKIIQLTQEQKDHLMAYLTGGGKKILVEPEALLASQAKFPGLDGEKMSKSYHNVIALRDAPPIVEKKIKSMPTDPARVRRIDPGNPEKCPVWNLHQVYASAEIKNWVQKGCRTAAIGCLDCKQPLIDSINKELAPQQQRLKDLIQSTDEVKRILKIGNEKARAVAQETLQTVKQSMGLFL